MKDTLNEECNVRVVARDRQTGEVLHVREGHNVWTTTGREYSALLKTYRPNGDPFRNDRIAYVGLGAGTQPETVDVNRVVDPLPIGSGNWLKGIRHAETTFPDSGSRLAVRYVVRFESTDLLPSGEDTEVYISECGLFTDGHSATFEVGQRDVTYANASLQSPVAYHTFAPIPKTRGIEIELIWELRH